MPRKPNHNEQRERDLLYLKEAREWLAAVRGRRHVFKCIRQIAVVFSASPHHEKRRAPARGLPRLVRITQNALPPRRNTAGRVENALNAWQFCDDSLSISLLTTRIWPARLTPHG